MELRLTYDPDADALSIDWASGVIAESDEVVADVILDYDAGGVVMGIEVLNASKHIEFLSPGCLVSATPPTVLNIPLQGAAAEAVGAALAKAAA